MKRTAPLASLFRRDDGMAAVEFALISPILILLFFGTVELANLLIADSKLRNVAASVADLVTQKAGGKIAATDLNIANIAVTEIMRPLPVTDGANPLVAVMVTDYRPTSTTAGNVVWTRTIYGGGSGPTTTTQLGLINPPCSDTGIPASLLPKEDTSPFNDVIRVIAHYNWSPQFSMIYNFNVMLESTSYNLPRYSLNIDADSSLSPACN